MERQPTPLDIIASAKRNDSHAEHRYLHGDCYKFYCLLSMFFPEAEAYMSRERDHVVTKIDGRLYDITGRISRKHADNYHLMDETEHRVASKWSCREPKKKAGMSCGLR